MIRNARGFTLLEMLVALLVLSLGLLGIAGLQAMSLRNNTNAFLRSQANVLAYDIVDRMRANRDAAVAGDYNIALGASASGSGLALADLTDWKALLASSLTNGDGAVTCTAAGLCTVTVEWDEVAAGGADRQFLLSTEL
jgi:type IV pilus assembly protein PilV